MHSGHWGAAALVFSKEIVRNGTWTWVDVSGNCAQPSYVHKMFELQHCCQVTQFLSNLERSVNQFLHLIECLKRILQYEAELYTGSSNTITAVTEQCTHILNNPRAISHCSNITCLLHYLRCILGPNVKAVDHKFPGSRTIPTDRSRTGSENIKW